MKRAIATALATTVLSGTAFAQSHDNRIDLIRPDAPALAAPGDHAIGVRTVKVVNPDQIDILSVKDGEPLPRYDRPLTLEVWYPSTGPKAGPGSQDYEGVYLRDGETRVTLHGSAVRDAEPDTGDGPYPLILISHGYPGNRFLMSDLGENLATKGYVTVSIGHTDSTYHDKAAFGSTLVNRPLDQLFVLNAVDKLSNDNGSFLDGLVDASTTGLIGYSMGAYGAVIVAGGGVTETSTKYDWGAPAGTLAIHQAGTQSHEKLSDPRIKAIVAIAPWGRNTGFWDAEGLKGVKTPIFFMAGSQDDVAGYEDGTKKIFQEAVNDERYLLTFKDANHNAAAPIPAPVESWEPVESLDFAPFEHYADAVWDTVRMNNIAEHFITAYFGRMLRGDTTMDDYLDLVEDAQAGVSDRDDAGNPTPDDTYWKGFAPRTAKGLTLMHETPAE